MEQVQTQVDELVYETKESEIKLYNTFNEFIMLSNSKFIENVCIHTIVVVTNNNNNNDNREFMMKIFLKRQMRMQKIKHQQRRNCLNQNRQHKTFQQLSSLV
jgi:hypothetical protein